MAEKGAKRVGVARESAVPVPVGLVGSFGVVVAGWRGLVPCSEVGLFDVRVAAARVLVDRLAGGELESDLSDLSKVAAAHRQLSAALVELRRMVDVVAADVADMPGEVGG